MTSATLAGGAARTSALSSRISSVLSVSFSDPEIRSALESLDAQGFKNTADNRRNLVLNLQQEVIEGNGAIIDDFGKVADQLKRVGQALSSLQQSCVEIRQHIAAANHVTKPVLDEANDLLAEKADVENRQALLSAFRQHFIITDDDKAILSSNSSPVDNTFFDTVVKVKRINNESRLLLGGSNEKLGLDILEQSSRQLNLAYQKLYRWIQSEFKTLDLENPQIGVTMRRAIRVLADRPQLFQSWMDSFAESREHILIDSFNVALASLAPQTVPGSIDLQPQDPLRYIGDMLAWTHSATISERESLEVLFVAEGSELAAGLKAGIKSDPFSRNAEQQTDTEAPFDGRKTLSDLVSRIIAGAGRTLRQKTEQTISSHEDATMSYKAANLITFYRRTFERILSPSATFLDTLDKLVAFCLGQFRSNMRNHVASVQAELRYVPADAGAPEFLEEALGTLRGLMLSYDGSMSSREDRAEEFEPILQEALDPFLNACQVALKQLAPPKRDVFALNCLLSAKATLAPFSGFTADRIAIVEGIMNRHVEALIDALTGFMIDASGLSDLVAAIVEADLDDDVERASTEALKTLAALPILQHRSLTTLSQELDDFLPSAIMDARDQLKGLKSAVIGRKVTEQAAEGFCEEFERVEEVLLAVDRLEVDDESDEIRISLRESFPRTSEEVRVLLS